MKAKLEICFNKQLTDVPDLSVLELKINGTETTACWEAGSYKLEENGHAMSVELGGFYLDESIAYKELISENTIISLEDIVFEDDNNCEDKAFYDPDFDYIISYFGIDFENNVREKDIINLNRYLDRDWYTIKGGSLTVYGYFYRVEDDSIPAYRFVGFTNCIAFIGDEGIDRIRIEVIEENSKQYIEELTSYQCYKRILKLMKDCKPLPYSGIVKGIPDGYYMDCKNSRTVNHQKPEDKLLNYKSKLIYYIVCDLIETAGPDLSEEEKNFLSECKSLKEAYENL